MWCVAVCAFRELRIPLKQRKITDKKLRTRLFHCIHLKKSEIFQKSNISMLHFWVWIVSLYRNLYRAENFRINFSFDVTFCCSEQTYIVEMQVDGFISIPVHTFLWALSHLYRRLEARRSHGWLTVAPFIYYWQTNHFICFPVVL